MEIREDNKCPCIADTIDIGKELCCPKSCKSCENKDECKTCDNSAHRILDETKKQ